MLGLFFFRSRVLATALHQLWSLFIALPLLCKICNNFHVSRRYLLRRRCDSLGISALHLKNDWWHFSLVSHIEFIDRNNNNNRTDFPLSNDCLVNVYIDMQMTRVSTTTTNDSNHLMFFNETFVQHSLLLLFFLLDSK